MRSTSGFFVGDMCLVTSLLLCRGVEYQEGDTRQLCKERKSMMKWAQCVHITYHAKTIRRNLSTVKCFVNVNVSVFMCEQIKPPLAANTHLGTLSRQSGDGGYESTASHVRRSWKRTTGVSYRSLPYPQTAATDPYDGSPRGTTPGVVGAHSPTPTKSRARPSSSAPADNGR